MAESRLDNPAVSHEKSDVDLRRISSLGAGLSLLVAVILGLLVWLFGYFNARELRRGHAPQGIPKSAPLVFGDADGVVVIPRAAEEKVLTSYGWIDKDKGIVRIPIERAMEIFAQRQVTVKKQRR